MNERPVPAAAQRDAAAVEMLRVWIHSRKQGEDYRGLIGPLR